MPVENRDSSSPIPNSFIVHVQTHYNVVYNCKLGPLQLQARANQIQ